MTPHLGFHEKRKFKHVYSEPYIRGAERICTRCGLEVTYLIELPYCEFTTKNGEYGDTQYSRLPQCVPK